MTRILVVTATYPPHHTGGYEVSCRDVVTRLVARGHDVTVLTGDDRLPGVTDPGGERDGAPAVRRDLRRYFRDEQLWAPGPVARWKVERDNQRAVRSALAAARPDVVAVWHIGAVSLGVLTTLIDSGRPLVYAVSDDWLSYCTTLDRWTTLLRRAGPVRPWLRPVLRVPTVVPDIGRSGSFCFISETTRRRAEELSPWTFPDSTIVYSGIDGALFAAVAAAPRDPAWTGRLLFVGRLDPRKGLETAVRALPLLDGHVLEVQATGDPVEEERILALADDLGVRDRLDVRRVPRSDLPARYRAADACVFPSEWVEPFGLVPLEAMAVGTPVVATGVGGSGELLVDGRNCLRFAAGDPAGLAAAVGRLAADEGLRSRLVEAGRRTAAYFDVDHLTDVLEQWYVGAAVGFPDGRPASRHFSIDAPADG